MNDFAINLYKQFSKNKGNMVFSPYSIANALAILSEGADGNTKKEIDNAIGHFVQVFAEELLVANSLWLQQDYDFLPEFDDAVKKFQPDICKVDFKSNIDKIVAKMNVLLTAN